MDGVDVVSGGDVADDLADEGAVFGLSRVEVELFAVLEKAFGVLEIDVGGVEGVGIGGGNAVGVEPGVKFHVAVVGEFDEVGHGVEVVGGGLSLAAGEVAAPGFDFGVVEGVGGGADLEDDGVDVEGLEFVEEVCEVDFHLGNGHGSVLVLVDNVYPGSAKFAFGGDLGGQAGAYHEKKEKGKEGVFHGRMNLRGGFVFGILKKDGEEDTDEEGVGGEGKPAGSPVSDVVGGVVVDDCFGSVVTQNGSKAVGDHH